MLNWESYLESNPKVLYGKPIIKGTRIAVDLILEKMAAGDCIDELLDAYPKISQDAIYACLAFASQAIKNEVV